MADEETGLEALIEAIIASTEKSLAEGSITAEDALTGLTVILSDIGSRGASHDLLKRLEVFRDRLT